MTGLVYRRQKTVQPSALRAYPQIAILLSRAASNAASEQILGKRVASWVVTDEFWQRVEPLVPPRVVPAEKKYQRKPGAGRPPEYGDMRGIAWRWQSIDGAMMKVPLAQEAVGPNPTDRGGKCKQASSVGGRSWRPGVARRDRGQRP
jgi:hypothetical protein